MKDSALRVLQDAKDKPYLDLGSVIEALHRVGELTNEEHSQWTRIEHEMFQARFSSTNTTIGEVYA